MLNTLLLVPLGAAIALLLTRRAWPIAILVGFALSATVEYAQLSIPGRVPDADRSTHDTGRALDIAAVDAQAWLIEHGARYGICQTYANERWHFELVLEPGGVCPPMKPDASS